MAKAVTPRTRQGQDRSAEASGFADDNGPSGEPEAPREAVLSARRRFFDTMAARDVAGATAVVLPEGRFYSARVADGKPVTRTVPSRGRPPTTRILSMGRP